MNTYWYKGGTHGIDVFCDISDNRIQVVRAKTHLLPDNVLYIYLLLQIYHATDGMGA